MSYSSETIARTIRRLNTSYYLPAIQREFVWKPDQIIRLFDSILRGYPISSFLFWELTSENSGKWQAYEFLSDVHSDGSRNTVANTSGVSDLHLILDGQQRLTSLNVGLRGHYTVRPKYSKRNKVESSWKLRLFLNLFHDPLGDEVEQDGMYYDLAFRRDGGMVEGRCWFPVGQILQYETRESLDQAVDEVGEGLPDETTKLQVKLVRRNLTRLWEAIHLDRVISYYAEGAQDYDRVLDIFVRANSGGTKLSKSDLLMSTVTGGWEGINAREEIHGFVDRLNSDLTGRNRFGTDFVMKSCLVLCDLPVAYRVQNFNEENLTKIRHAWPEIKRAIESGVDVVNRFGIDRDTLTSANALIPILYYLFKRPSLDIHGSTSYAVRNRGRLRRWLIGVLLNGAFSAASDGALTQARSVLARTPTDENFPSDELDGSLRRAGIVTGLEAAIESALDTGYGDRRDFLALSLLYEDRPWGTVKHHIDHVFPKSLLQNRDALEAVGLRLEQVNDLRDRIGNLSLLVDHENEEKNARPFLDWIATRDESYLQRHAIPTDKALWTLGRFPDFVEEREVLLRERVQAQLIPAL